MPLTEVLIAFSRNTLVVGQSVVCQQDGRAVKKPQSSYSACIYITSYLHEFKGVPVFILLLLYPIIIIINILCNVSHYHYYITCFLLLLSQYNSR